MGLRHRRWTRAHRALGLKFTNLERATLTGGLCLRLREPTSRRRYISRRVADNGAGSRKIGSSHAIVRGIKCSDSTKHSHHTRYGRTARLRPSDRQVREDTAGLHKPWRCPRPAGALCPWPPSSRPTSGSKLISFRSAAISRCSVQLGTRCRPLASTSQSTGQMCFLPCKAEQETRRVSTQHSRTGRRECIVCILYCAPARICW